MSGKVQFQHGGRTERGKVSDISSEDHYRRRITNWLDGLDQAKRKQAFRALGLDPERDAKREIDERLKKGDVDIDELIARAGGEKLPGCGAIVIMDVGARRTNARIISEEKAGSRIKALSRVNYYFRRRTGKTRHGKERTGERKEWPGLVKRMVSLSPGDSQALIGAVKSGAMTAEEFRDHLTELSELMRDRFREATKLPGALKGLEAEMIIWHLEQGCVHAHIYARDIDLSEPDRPRLGLFGCSTEVKKRSAAPRLTLNPLGVSGVAMRRHRKAGHVAPAKAFERVVRDEAGEAVLDSGGKKQTEEWFCTDWTVLEVTEGKREAKGLGKCWDSVLADQVDGYWEGVLSTPALKRYRDEAHAKWAKDWEAECAAKLKDIWAKAELILGPKLKELEDRIAKADAERAERQFYDNAFASGAPVLAYCLAAAWAEAEGELADLADAERREREALQAEAAKAKADAAAKVNTERRERAKVLFQSTPDWLSDMALMLTSTDPAAALRRIPAGRQNMWRIDADGLPELVGGRASIALVVEHFPTSLKAATLSHGVTLLDVARQDFQSLKATKGLDEAKALWSRRVSAWQNFKQYVPAEPVQPAPVVVERVIEKVVEREVIKVVPVPAEEIEKLVQARLEAMPKPEPVVVGAKVDEAALIARGERIGVAKHVLYPKVDAAVRWLAVHHAGDGGKMPAGVAEYVVPNLGLTGCYVFSAKFVEDLNEIVDALPSSGEELRMRAESCEKVYETFDFESVADALEAKIRGEKTGDDVEKWVDLDKRVEPEWIMAAKVAMRDTSTDWRGHPVVLGRVKHAARLVRLASLWEDKLTTKEKSEVMKDIRSPDDDGDRCKKGGSRDR